MRILVFGHNGMLGSDVIKAFSGNELYGLSVEDIDIGTFDAVEEKIKAISPELIINCAAYTNVDGCETEIGTAFHVNAEGVKNISIISEQIRAKLVHISTDYVFDGDKETPYTEDDETNPLSVYGQSKLKGEEYVRELLDDYLIVRIQWLYGKEGKNFVKTMLHLSETNDQLNVVNDQFGSPTYTKDVANILNVMVDKNLNGTYHVSNAGYTSWHGFTKKIFEYLRTDVIINEVSSKEFIRPAKRPHNSVFDLSKLYKDTNEKMPAWEDALKRYLAEINRI